MHNGMQNCTYFKMIFIKKIYFFKYFIDRGDWGTLIVSYN